MSDIVTLSFAVATPAVSAIRTALKSRLSDSLVLFDMSSLPFVVVKCTGSYLVRRARFLVQVSVNGFHGAPPAPVRIAAQGDVSAHSPPGNDFLHATVVTLAGLMSPGDNTV